MAVDFDDRLFAKADPGSGEKIVLDLAEAWEREPSP